MILERSGIIEYSCNPNGMKVLSNFVPIVMHDDFSSERILPESAIYTEEFGTRIMVVCQDPPQKRRIFLNYNTTKEREKLQRMGIKFKFKNTIGLNPEGDGRRRLVDLMFPEVIYLFGVTKMLDGTFFLSDFKLWGKIKNKVILMPLPNINIDGRVCLGDGGSSVLFSLRELEKIKDRFWNTWFNEDVAEMVNCYEEHNDRPRIKIKGLVSWEYYSQNEPNQLLKEDNNDYWIFSLSSFDDMINRERRLMSYSYSDEFVDKIEFLNNSYLLSQLDGYVEITGQKQEEYGIQQYDWIDPYGMVYKVFSNEDQTKVVFLRGTYPDSFKIIPIEDVMKGSLKNYNSYRGIEVGKKYLILGERLEIIRIFKLCGLMAATVKYNSSEMMTILLEKSLVVEEIKK